MIRSILATHLSAADTITQEFGLVLTHALKTSLLQAHSIDFTALLNTLPPSKEKATASGLLVELLRRGRLLRCSDVHSSPCTLSFLDPAEFSEADLVIRGTGTGPHITHPVVVDLADYPYSAAALEITNQRYSKGRTTRMEWEATIIGDIAKAALSFAIIDRYIGSWSPTFQSTLGWFVPSLQAQRPGAPVEIYTSISDLDTERAISLWARPLGVRIHNRRRRDFPHARYLLSDKFALHIDRGFDLDDRGAVEPSEVWVFADPLSILAEVQNKRPPW